MSRLIANASIIPLSQPTLIPGSIDQFAAEQGLTHLADDVSTPLGRLAAASNNWSKSDDIHNDGQSVIEFAGRQCYGAYAKGRNQADYLDNILAMAHGSVLAHAKWSFVLTGISRSLTLELNRHGIGTAISQESQRFVDASTVKFVVPPALLALWDGDLSCADAQDFLTDNVRQVEAYNRWQAEVESMIGDYEKFPLEPFIPQVMTYTDETDRKEKAERKRAALLTKRGNETARCVLPNDCETKMVWSANARALRHIISLRGAFDADLEIRRFAAQLAIHCKLLAPDLFADVEITPGDFAVPVVATKYLKP